MREPGWYIVDRSHDNRCLRGPYKTEYAAGAIRTEMELSWDDYDGEFPDTRNLWIVGHEQLDDLERRKGTP